MVFKKSLCIHRIYIYNQCLKKVITQSYTKNHKEAQSKKLKQKLIRVILCVLYFSAREYMLK